MQCNVIQENIRAVLEDAMSTCVKLLTEGLGYPASRPRVEGFYTESDCLYDWLVGGEGCAVVVWNAALSGIKNELEQRIGISGGLFVYEFSVLVECLDV